MSAGAVAVAARPAVPTNYRIDPTVYDSDVKGYGTGAFPNVLRCSGLLEHMDNIGRTRGVRKQHLLQLVGA